MRCLRKIWQQWQAPSPEAEAACIDAEVSYQRAARDLDRAVAGSKVAEELTQLAREHNAANRFDDWLAGLGARQ